MRNVDVQIGINQEFTGDSLVEGFDVTYINS